MDVIRSLLGFAGVFVGLGEGVCLTAGLAYYSQIQAGPMNEKVAMGKERDDGDPCDNGSGL